MMQNHKPMSKDEALRVASRWLEVCHFCRHMVYADDTGEVIQCRYEKGELTPEKTEAGCPLFGFDEESGNESASALIEDTTQHLMAIQLLRNLR